jgi:hypothetical protein
MLRRSDPNQNGTSLWSRSSVEAIEMATSLSWSMRSQGLLWTISGFMTL